jgi:hypothetical protein
MKKPVIFIMLFILVFIGYNYVNKPGRNIANELPDFKVNSIEIKDEFFANQDRTLHKYLNKIIQVSGEVTDISSNNLVLDDFISAQLMDTVFVNTNDFITIKGRFIGYDDLLEELKIDQSTIINKQ